jgi:uncharacterized hydrophobic protein (TIGR00271 family)
MADTSLDDLQDGDAELSQTKAARSTKDWSLEDRKVLAQAILRGGVVIIAGILAISLPERSADATAEIIGATALVIAAGTLIVDLGWRTSQGNSRFTLLGQAIALTAAGLVLIAWPGATLEVIGRIIGTGIIALGFISIWRGLANRANRSSNWLLARGTLLLLAGAFVLIFPMGTGLILLWGLAFTWAIAAITSAIALVLRQPRPDMYDEPVEPHRLAADWLRRYEMDGAQRIAVSDKLYFEGATFRGRLWRYAVLMFLSTSIATFGVASDSTAVVIGAMLIAPLMTPIMGLTGALVMAWPKRAARSAATVGGGVVMAVFVAWMITGLSPQISETILTSSQITSRVNPTLLDLGIALAAGAAGAFALSRPDVADSLPGVAIAVALVPPLAVVGTTLQLGAWDEAVGASLLFLTNLVAIILAGGFVFILTGYSPIHRITQRGESIRLSFAAVGVMMLIILIPLALTTRSILQDSLGSDEAFDSVSEWLEDTDLSIIEVDLDGSDVSVVITGNQVPPPIEELGASLESSLGREIEVELRIIPSQTMVYDSGAD